jgi:hypothetical protein
MQPVQIDGMIEAVIVLGTESISSTWPVKRVWFHGGSPLSVLYQHVQKKTLEQTFFDQTKTNDQAAQEMTCQGWHWSVGVLKCFIFHQ